MQGSSETETEPNIWFSKLATTEHAQHSEKLWKRVFNFVCWKFLQMVQITVMIALLEEEGGWCNDCICFIAIMYQPPSLPCYTQYFLIFLFRENHWLHDTRLVQEGDGWGLVPSIHIQWYHSPITLLAGGWATCSVCSANIQLLLARTLDFKYLMSCKHISDSCVLKA